MYSNNRKQQDSELQILLNNVEDIVLVIFEKQIAQ